MKCDGKIGRMICIIEIRDANVGEYPTEDMRFANPDSIGVRPAWS